MYGSKRTGSLLIRASLVRYAMRLTYSVCLHKRSGVANRRNTAISGQNLAESMHLSGTENMPCERMTS